MGADDRITVGLPAYNEERALPRALRSLEDQRCPADARLRIIVAANGCTDRTVEVGREFGLARGAAAVEIENGQARCWRFDCPRYELWICELPQASKGLALRFIHEQAAGDVVIVLDSDAWFADGDAVRLLCEALADHPDHGASAPVVAGRIAPFDRAANPVAEVVRILVSRAVNAFDAYRPRLDGRGYAYRKRVVPELPGLIAIDLWLDATVHERSAGCVYVAGARLGYQLPRTWGDLVRQYVRYDRTIRDLRAGHPRALSSIREARAGARRAAPWWFVLHRGIGWLFLHWIALAARGHVYQEDRPWEVIESTKA
jgi:glycosyltransferase involved in cell wall biosynthesis